MSKFIFGLIVLCVPYNIFSQSLTDCKVAFDTLQNMLLPQKLNDCLCGTNMPDSSKQQYIDSFEKVTFNRSYRKFRKLPVKKIQQQIEIMTRFCPVEQVYDTLRRNYYAYEGSVICSYIRRHIEKENWLKEKDNNEFKKKCYAERLKDFNVLPIKNSPYPVFRFWYHGYFGIPEMLELYRPEKQKKWRAKRYINHCEDELDRKTIQQVLPDSYRVPSKLMKTLFKNNLVNLSKGKVFLYYSTYVTDGWSLEIEYANKGAYYVEDYPNPTRCEAYPFKLRNILNIINVLNKEFDSVVKDGVTTP